MITEKMKYSEELSRIESLSGYYIDLISIRDFYSYYKNNLDYFYNFSEKAFLKSIKIPSQYFLEQPEETREELLENRLESITNSKLNGKYLAILKKDNSILNCARVDKNELENLYERVYLDDLNLKKLNFIKDFTKDGYSSNFVSLVKEKEGKYNLGLFIDYPLMYNKNPIINIGFYYIPKKGEDNYKNLYIESSNINFEDYHSLYLLIEDIDNILLNIDEEEIIQSLKDKQLLREVDEVLIKLSKQKVISKGYVKKISKHITKNNIQITSVFSFIELLSSYELNFSSYKQSIKIRSCIKDIDKILKN